MSASNAGRIGVWGGSGSGKSSYLKWRLSGLKRVVVFDPMDEYAEQGMQRCRTVDEVRKAMVKSWKTFRIAYVPPAGKEPRALHQLSLLMMDAQQPFKQARKGAMCTLVVEEMNLAFRVHGGDSKAPGFAEICSRGRHFGIEVIGASQRLAEVATRFRGNTTETVILRQQGRNDIQAARDATGMTLAEVESIKVTGSDDKKVMQFAVCKEGHVRRGKLFWKRDKPHVSLDNAT